MVDEPDELPQSPPMRGLSEQIRARLFGSCRGAIRGAVGQFPVLYDPRVC